MSTKDDRALTAVTIACLGVMFIGMPTIFYISGHDPKMLFGVGWLDTERIRVGEAILTVCLVAAIGFWRLYRALKTKNQADRRLARIVGALAFVSLFSIPLAVFNLAMYVEIDLGFGLVIMSFASVLGAVFVYLGVTGSGKALTT